MSLINAIEKLHNALSEIANESNLISVERDRLDQQSKVLSAKEQAVKEYSDGVVDKLRQDKLICDQNTREKQAIDLKLKELDEKAPRIEKRFMELIEKDEQVKKQMADLATAQISHSKAPPVP